MQLLYQILTFRARNTIIYQTPSEYNSCPDPPLRSISKGWPLASTTCIASSRSMNTRHWSRNPCSSFSITERPDSLRPIQSACYRISGSQWRIPTRVTTRPSLKVIRLAAQTTLRGNECILKSLHQIIVDFTFFITFCVTTVGL